MLCSRAEAYPPKEGFYPSVQHGFWGIGIDPQDWPREADLARMLANQGEDQLGRFFRREELLPGRVGNAPGQCALPALARARCCDTNPFSLRFHQGLQLFEFLGKEVLKERRNDRILTFVIEIERSFRETSLLDTIIHAGSSKTSPRKHGSRRSQD